jgi:hypothetical protein
MKMMHALTPDVFKVAMMWKVFAEVLEAYLDQLLGSGQVPLKNMIRRN